MRVLACSLVGMLLSAALPVAAQDAGAAPDYDHALATAFQTLCGVDHPSFDRIKGIAEALPLKPWADGASVQSSVTAPTRSLRLTGSLVSKPFVLVLDEHADGNGHGSLSCAVLGHVKDADAFSSTVAEAMDLPAAQPETADGVRSYTWNMPSDTGAHVVVGDLTPGGKSMVIARMMSDGQEASPSDHPPVQALPVN